MFGLFNGGLFSDNSETALALAELKRQQYMDEITAKRLSLFQATEAGIYGSIATSIGVGSRATANTITYDQFMADKDKSTPEVSVEEIHREFLTAGDVMLEKAKEVIAQSVIKDEEKVVQMQRFGFNNTKQVVQASQIQQKRSHEQRLADVITDFRVQYPNHKFITVNIAEQICRKYGLVMGEVAQFKGFVPKKNVDEIAAFFEAYPEEEFYYIGYSNRRGEFTTSKEIYEAGKDNDITNWNGEQEQFKYQQRKHELSICAPLKDMNTEGMQVRGVQLVAKQYPDPVVLLPKKHANGVEGFLILTAWGDEASDELVVDQNKN